MSVLPADASVVFTNDSGLSIPSATGVISTAGLQPVQLYFVTRTGIRALAPAHRIRTRPGVVRQYKHNWAIFNEDLASMPISAAFNVYGRTRPTTSTCIPLLPPTQSATGPTSITSTQHNPTSGVGDAGLDPGGVGGRYNNHNLGVWYDTYAGKWAIFNQDGRRCRSARRSTF